MELKVAHQYCTVKATVRTVVSKNLRME